MSAETATVRLKQPVKSLLHGIPNPYTPDHDRIAVCTAREEQPYQGADHDAASGLTVVEYGPGELSFLRVIRRLDSRAACNCSGVLTSGCDRVIRSRARETLRLWFFCNLLFIFFCPGNVTYSAGQDGRNTLAQISALAYILARLTFSLRGRSRSLEVA